MSLLGKHSDGGHDEELWLVSYADMMTLLFGFFVILYSLSQVDDKKFQAMGKQMAEAFGGKIEKVESSSEVGMMMENRHLRALQLLVAMLNLGDTVDEAVERLEKATTESKNFMGAKEMIEEKMKVKNEGLESLKAVAQSREDRVDIALPDSTLFESGTANLTPRAKEAIKRIAGFLSNVQGLAALEVTGHTDSAPPSAKSIFSNNWGLSAARAGAVAEELIKDGIDPKILATRGMASLQPLFPERKEDGTPIPENMTKNRRVQIVVKKVKHGESN